MYTEYTNDAVLEFAEDLRRPCSDERLTEEVFSVCIVEERAGLVVDADVVDTARGPSVTASGCKSMMAYGNHFQVLGAEESLKTSDSGVAAIFSQVCWNGVRDANPIEANVEYIGHIEEILELNYRRHFIKVLVCDFVKANYRGGNATVKKIKWGFTIINYDRWPGAVCRDSFAFPKQCQRVFYCDATEAPGWRVVLRKDVRAKRVLQSVEEEANASFFNVGSDEDYAGLRPHREVGEGEEPPIATGHNVHCREMHVMGRPAATRGSGNVNKGRGSRGRIGQGGRAGNAGTGRGLGRGLRRGAGRGSGRIAEGDDMPRETPPRNEVSPSDWEHEHRQESMNGESAQRGQSGRRRASENCLGGDMRARTYRLNEKAAVKNVMKTVTFQIERR